MVMKYSKYFLKLMSFFTVFLTISLGITSCKSDEQLYSEAKEKWENMLLDGIPKNDDPRFQFDVAKLLNIEKKFGEKYFSERFSDNRFFSKEEIDEIVIDFDFKTLMKRFEDNSVLAEDLYLNKWLRIYDGEIESVDDGYFSDEIVSVEIRKANDPYAFGTIECMHSRKEKIVKELKKGMNPVVTGILVKESTGLVLEQCFYDF